MNAFNIADQYNTTYKTIDPLIPAYATVARGLFAKDGTIVFPADDLVLCLTNILASAGSAAAIATKLAGTMLTGKAIATPVAAAGTDAATAAVLGSGNIMAISSDGAGKGVKLLSVSSGTSKRLYNTTATAAILYPATGGTINGLAANAGVVIPASTGLVIDCTAANTWLASVMGARATAA